MRFLEWLFYQFLRVMFWTILKLYNRLGVSGAQKVPDRGGVIIAVNHSSHLDPPILGAAFRRKLTFMARDDLFTIPVIGRVVGLFSIAVNRDNPRPSTIKETVRRLRGGEAVVVFPGGTRDSKEMKRGVGVLARLSGAPVVPVRIEGSGLALGRGSKLPRPAKISVKIKDPISIDRDGGRDLQEKLFDDIMASIQDE